MSQTNLDIELQNSFVLPDDYKQTGHKYAIETIDTMRELLDSIGDIFDESEGCEGKRLQVTLNVKIL